MWCVELGGIVLSMALKQGRVRGLTVTDDLGEFILNLQSTIRPSSFDIDLVSKIIKPRHNMSTVLFAFRSLSEFQHHHIPAHFLIRDSSSL